MKLRLLQPWSLWALGSMLASLGLCLALTGSQRESSNRINAWFLPGQTTHGHYQIELKCSACHDSSGVAQEQRCLDCHEQELKLSKDTHPKSKFADPARFVFLEKIDASNCLTCHQEHAPERTLAMGLTIPIDYCWHCHDDIADERPSHRGMEFNTCLNAGCHNYHDNTALYENFLLKHSDEPHLLEEMTVLPRKNPALKSKPPLIIDEIDAPQNKATDPEIIDDWASTAHASHGVNCSHCHSSSSENVSVAWRDQVDHTVCQSCHDQQVASFFEGKHGMRLAAGLSPMTPEKARSPMRHDALHRTMNCNACHPGHRFDTNYAAKEACLKCHNDEHSLAYQSSSHHELWKQERDGSGKPGSGVNCATCHMPRVVDSDGTTISVHNQNWNLAPNEKMARSVCMKCHGLAFTLDALSSPELIANCFSTPPSTHVPSIEMAQKWFKTKPQKRKKSTKP